MNNSGRASYPRVALAAALLAALPVGASRGAPLPEVEASVAWDSKYVSEGRDQLDGAGLASATVTTGWLGFDLGAWYAAATRGNYREINLSLGRSFALGPVELGVSYTRLEFRGGGSFGDNELAAGAAADLPLGLSVEATATYSTEAGGTFLEGWLQRTWQREGSPFSFTPFAAVGADHGYASEDYDGFNHVQVGVEVEIALGDRASLAGYVARSWGLGDVDAQGLGDVTWGGARLSLAF